MKTHLITGAVAAAMLAMTGCASSGDSNSSSTSASQSDSSSRKSRKSRRGGTFTSKSYTAGSGDVRAAAKRALDARRWTVLSEGGNTIDARQVGRKQSSDVRITINGSNFTIAHIGGESEGSLNGWATNLAFDTMVFSGLDRVTATERAGRRSRRR